MVLQASRHCGSLLLHLYTSSYIYLLHLILVTIFVSVSLFPLPPMIAPDALGMLFFLNFFFFLLSSLLFECFFLCCVSVMFVINHHGSKNRAGNWVKAGYSNYDVWSPVNKQNKKLIVYTCILSFCTAHLFILCIETRFGVLFVKNDS